MKPIILATIAACSLLSGCANLKFAWSASYMTDNLAEDLRQASKAAAKPEVPPVTTTEGERK